MKQFLINHFHFTRIERLGVAGLLMICLAVYTAPAFWFRRHDTGKTDFSAFKAEIASASALDPATAGVDHLTKAGFSQKAAQAIVQYREKGGKLQNAADLKAIAGLDPADAARLAPLLRPEHTGQAKTVAAALFPFDPNTADETDLRRLGLPTAAVHGILSYRNKGGVFRKPADVAKIYALPPAEFRRIEPFISLAAPAGAPARAREAVTVDINAGDAAAWGRLPGIGEKRAQQILKYRAALGGFSSPAQVAETFGLPDSVFQAILPYLRGGAGPQKIALNTATEAELDRHPYISPKQARLIVAYRDQHGPFHSVDELQQIIPLRDPVWLEKVRGYLGVE